MSDRAIAERAIEEGRGILRLSPTWVPRSFCVPGRRIKLHPDDYYAMGGDRGGIDERWFSSTTKADNGPKTQEFEGHSFVLTGSVESPEKVLLAVAIEELKSQVVGERLWNRYGGWPMYSKFFDNKGALPHHIHHRDSHAALVDQPGKPEAYFFPPQVNNHGGDFPYTFFGLKPGTTKEELRECLENFTRGDNKITNISSAYRLEPGTAWNVPAGVLHAPGSLCTYEPQRASDVFAMFQSLTGDSIVAEDLLWKDTPPDKVGDFDYLLNLVDWEANVDPDFAKKHFMRPVPVRPMQKMREQGYEENWIVYRSPDFSAKELTVFPGRTVTVRDSAAYGMIMMQGHGTMGVWEVETPALIRYGQLTYDEFFVTEDAAGEGITITNPSKSDPIVMLKHFGPANPDLDLMSTDGRK